MQLVDYPQEMKDRLAAGKSAELRAEFRAYVGNLPFGTAEEELLKLFEPFGNVVQVDIMVDSDGRSRGFAFVGMEILAEGKAAVEQLNGYPLSGRQLQVSEGKQQSRAPRGRGDA